MGAAVRAPTGAEARTRLLLIGGSWAGRCSAPAGTTPPAGPPDRDLRHLAARRIQREASARPACDPCEFVLADPCSSASDSDTVPVRRNCGFPLSSHDTYGSTAPEEWSVENGG
ncbi:hypothetical protein GCM10010472_69760 [Pseudonocardia halophobica]|uniref:Uncharacterized protein n=1 Tax=Pseudonocardia halophobica TaxID=29401 RepID=A0A9W6L3N8_9PSEU|nr:hypothetical protein GCM10017577_35080 [Pseudonocardia halophobica]